MRFSVSVALQRRRRLSVPTKLVFIESSLSSSVSSAPGYAAAQQWADAAMGRCSTWIGLVWPEESFTVWSMHTACDRTGLSWIHDESTSCTSAARPSRSLPRSAGRDTWSTVRDNLLAPDAWIRGGPHFRLMSTRGRADVALHSIPLAWPKDALKEVSIRDDLRWLIICFAPRTRFRHVGMEHARVVACRVHGLRVGAIKERRREHQLGHVSWERTELRGCTPSSVAATLIRSLDPKEDQVSRGIPQSALPRTTCRYADGGPAVV